MPARFDMSWEPKCRRWWKQFRGHRYVVSCRQLKAPGTKLGSYQYANAWWKKKRAEILGQAAPHPFSDYLDLLENRLLLARHDGHHVRELTREIKRVRNGGTPRFLETNVPIESPSEMPTGKEDNLYQEYVDELVARALDPFDPAWNDQVARSRIKPTS